MKKIKQEHGASVIVLLILLVIIVCSVYVAVKWSKPYRDKRELKNYSAGYLVRTVPDIEAELIRKSRDKVEDIYVKKIPADIVEWALDWGIPLEEENISVEMSSHKIALEIEYTTAVSFFLIFKKNFDFTISLSHPL